MTNMPIHIAVNIGPGYDVKLGPGSNFKLSPGYVFKLLLAVLHLLSSLCIGHKGATV